MSNFIDLHCHVLPGVDDGAKTIGESEAMLLRYVELGFNTIVATPHLEPGSTGITSHGKQELLDDVGRIGSALGIRVLPGSEIRLTPETRSHPELLTGSTLGDSTSLLVDFPSGSWPFYGENAQFQIRLLGYKPILAHPERYGWQNEDLDIAHRLINRGIRLQVTLGSVAGIFGKAANRTAIRLLESGLVHVLATDSHGIGQRLDSVKAAVARLETTYEEGAINALLSDNPSAILDDADVEPVQCVRRKRRLFSFGSGRISFK